MALISVTPLPRSVTTPLRLGRTRVRLPLLAAPAVKVVVVDRNR